jgi:hypothetical protein
MPVFEQAKTVHALDRAATVRSASGGTEAVRGSSEHMGAVDGMNCGRKESARLRATECTKWPSAAGAPKRALTQVSTCRDNNSTWCELQCVSSCSFAFIRPTSPLLCASFNF